MFQSQLFKFATLSFFLFTTSAQTEVFKWTDENGQIHYSDKKPENQSAKEIKIKPHTQAITNNAEESTESLNTDVPALKIPKPYKKKQKITMYTASWCGYCKKARAYFKKNKINFTEYDIEKNANAQKRYQKLGGTGVPLLVAKRKTMQGFSTAKFKSWYETL